jgi:hypothetical protein
LALPSSFVIFYFPPLITHGQREPELTERSAIFGEIILTILEFAEIGHRAADPQARETARAQITPTITPDLYHAAVRGLLGSCIEGDLPDELKLAEPQHGQLLGLTLATYATIGLEAMSWAQAFGPNFATRVQALDISPPQ